MAPAVDTHESCNSGRSREAAAARWVHRQRCGHRGTTSGSTEAKPGGVLRFLKNRRLWSSMPRWSTGVTDDRSPCGSDFTANLQVFCRYKSGNGCPVSVYCLPSFVREAFGQSWGDRRGDNGLGTHACNEMNAKQSQWSPLAVPYIIEPITPRHVPAVWRSSSLPLPLQRHCNA